MNVAKSETYNKYNDGGEEITALYSRLSCDDDLQGDSNSIKTKRRCSANTPKNTAIKIRNSMWTTVTAVRTSTVPTFSE